MRLPRPDNELHLALPASLLAMCQQRICELWGLHFPPERWRDLSRHLRLVAGELDISFSACVDALLSEPPLPQVAAQCVRELTVGETYFLRDADFFAKLRQTVLLPLIAQRRATNDLRLKIWSAGCCTGEEAYTLAILLDGLLPDQECWQVQIIASDINPAFLALARQGSYCNWSFRQVSDGWRQRHFIQENNNRWHINERYRERVTFLEHNLVETFHSDPTRGLARCDVIVCRNVLMYFSPAQAASILRRMLNCLDGEGVLLLASQEGLLCQEAKLTPALWPGALCLRKQTVDQGDPDESRFVSLQQEATGRTATPLPLAAALLNPTYPASLPANPLLTEPAPPNPTLKQQAQTAALTARTCANRNQLQDALAWAEHALELDKLEPALYWLLASLQIEHGSRQQARATLRRAIYLQPDFVMAHYLSGLLNAGQGNPAGAARDWNNCLRLLEKLADDCLLPEAEGLSAQDVKKLIWNALEQTTNGTEV